MVSTRQMTIGGSHANDSTKFGRNQQSQPTASSSSASSSAVSLSTAASSTLSLSLSPYIPSNKHLLDLPEEVTAKIFGYLTFKNVCQLRLVCRQIDQICGHVLNSTFQRLQTQMLQRFHDIKSKMPRRESARRSHFLACESDIVETLHMRLTLLQMCFGKHIERRHCYFFPGEILDEVYRILYYIKITPKLDLPYKVTDELFDLSTMAMEYFKDKIEPHLPEIAYFSPNYLNFSGSSTSKFLLDTPTTMDLPSTSKTTTTKNNSASTSMATLSSSIATSMDASALSYTMLEEEEDDYTIVQPLIPQSNMVLRKRIRKIKQGMKRYNTQLSQLKHTLRSMSRKTSAQQRQIAQQQQQLQDQRTQTLEYANRLDDCDKKNEEMSRKFSTLLQALNKCRTELQYWRCKAPTSVCTNCGVAIVPDDLHEALLNDGVAMDTGIVATNAVNVASSAVGNGVNVATNSMSTSTGANGVNIAASNMNSNAMNVGMNSNCTIATISTTSNCSVAMDSTASGDNAVLPLCANSCKSKRKATTSSDDSSSSSSSGGQHNASSSGPTSAKKRRPSKVRKVKAKA